MIEIFKLNSISDPNERHKIIEEVKAIFYASSSLKEFSSEERKAAFFKRWCGDYIAEFSDQFLIMQEENMVLGYLSGCNDSNAALSLLAVPGYDLFSDLFEQFPAHFHINFHPAARGRGLGSELVKYYCDELRKQQIYGVHLVTSPDAANITFYRRLMFSHEVQREFQKMTLLLMGKILD